MAISQNFRTATAFANARLGKSFDWGDIPGQYCNFGNLTRPQAFPPTLDRLRDLTGGLDARAGELGVRRQKRSVCQTTALPG